MKRLLLSATAAIVLLTGCATGPAIHADYDSEVDFDRYRSFAFFDPLSLEQAGYQSLVGQHLRAAIRREMTARGYREVAEAPDLLINVSASLDEKLQVTEIPVAPTGYYGYRRGIYDPWLGYRYATSTHVSQYTEGTLNIDLVDRSANRMVWEGVAIGRLAPERNADELRQAIDDGVSAIFGAYPFRAGGG